MLDSLIENYVKRIYIQKDYHYFRERSKLTPVYLTPLLELIRSNCTEIIICNVEGEPSIEIRSCFEKFIKKEFVVEYNTLLKISKVADLFVFQHEFSVESRDPDRMSPVLDGFSQEAYTFSQNKLENEVSTFLETQHLHKLRLAEMDEVVENLKAPDNTIFGNQMTLENALFRDLYGICET